MTVNGHDVEARYRQVLLDQPTVSKVTLADGQLVEVKDIYVRRTLLHEVVQKQPERAAGGSVDPDDEDIGSQHGVLQKQPDPPEREATVKLPVDLWPKLLDERVVLVEGPAGMGKSTLTKQLVRESGDYHLIPIWISFRMFVSSGLSILEYLDQHYIPWLGLSDLRVPNRADETGRDRSLGQWCYDQWTSGLGVLILDGLDEVFRHKERVAALKALPITGTDRTRPATILTSRPLSQSLPLSMGKIEVQGLMPAEQKQFIENYQASLQLTDEHITRFTSTIQKQEQGRLQSLLTRPGHLIQILTTYARTNTILDSETSVLNSLLESRLTITGRSQPPVEGGDAKKKLQVLASLALHLLACRQGQRHTRAQLLALIQQVLHEQKQIGTPLFPLSQATALLNDLTRNSGLLTEVESEVYECESVIWLQHLTGTALANPNVIASLDLKRMHILDFLDKKAWDPEWEPVLKSWIGNGVNPFLLFACLMDEAHDDLARHRLGVAGRCLHEVCPEQKSQLWYQGLATRIPREAFAVWKANVKQDTADLVTTSLGRAWVETDVGQAELLAVLTDPLSTGYRLFHTLCDLLGPNMPRASRQWIMQRRMERRSDYQYRLVVQAMKVCEELRSTMPVKVQQVLMIWLEAQGSSEREAAVKALKSLGPTMHAEVQRALVARLEHPSSTVHEAAIEAVKGLGPAMQAEVQRALVARLEHPSSGVRMGAVEALKGLGPAMQAEVQRALITRLEDPSLTVREAAIEALNGSGPVMQVEVQRALVARLEDPEWTVRRGAVEGLGGLGAIVQAEVQQVLVGRLEDQNWTVRRATIEAFKRLRPAMPVQVRQALLVRLKDPDILVRREAVACLKAPVLARRSRAIKRSKGRGMAMSVQVQQELVARLFDPHRWVREEAIEVLNDREIAVPVEAQQALVAQLRHPHSWIRNGAIEVFKGLGRAMHAEVHQALIAQLEDRDQEVRLAAAWALEGMMGVGMPVAAQQVLVEQMVDSDGSVRRGVVRALAGLGAAMPVKVQQALVTQLRDLELQYYEREAAARDLFSAQQQGLRLFLRGTVAKPGRMVSELSETSPFSDSCHQSVLHAPAASAPLVFHRLPLMAL